jgi:hypothetical protein
MTGHWSIFFSDIFWFFPAKYLLLLHPNVTTLKGVH